MMASRTMKAVQLHEHGGPEVLLYEDVPIPELGSGEVLVRVHAAGANPPDWYARAGFTNMPQELRPKLSLPFTPGSDVSGVVEAVAADVHDLAPGDEVFGLVRFPSLTSRAYAEYVAAPASDLARKPSRIDHVHAAGLPMAGLTAWQYLIENGHPSPSLWQSTPHQPMQLGPRTTVLINGAAGGIGHFAVQLAKWKGARVIAVASGPHEAFLRELGADEFIDYTKTRAEEVVGDVDLVLDTVGGPDGHRFLRTVKRGGAIYPVFFGEYHREEAAARGITLSGTQVRSSRAQLAELAGLLDAGKLRVGIDSSFALAEARRAHERAARGHIQGKIVLTIT